MIISKLTGGLGNQMFQFAAAKALSLKLQTELVLDCTNFKISKDLLTPRDFELSVFEKEPFKYLSEKEKGSLLVEELSFGQKILNKVFGKTTCTYYREPSFKFNKHFSETQDNTYLIGYFQSEKYFSKYSEQIRSCFQFPEKISAENQSVIANIESNKAVSVHVRRGDYVKVASNLKHHGVCSVDYYQAAFEIIKEKIDNPVFYFFSDDIDWVKTNLSTGTGSHYIAHNTGAQSFEDMRLMSHCNHHIIANSSFSWWGAWLNPNKEKMVIAPNPWFGDPNKEKEATDLIPSNWIRVAK